MLGSFWQLAHRGGAAAAAAHLGRAGRLLASQLSATSSSPRALISSQEDVVDIFDGELKARHRDRAAFLATSADPLLETVTERLLDRLEDCKSKFKHAAVIGGAAEHVIRQLAGGRAGIERVTVIDTSQAVLDRIKGLELEHLQQQRDASTRSKEQSSSGSSNVSSSSSEDNRASSSEDDRANVSSSSSEDNRATVSSSSSEDNRTSSNNGSSSSSKGAWPTLDYALMHGEVLPVEPGTFDLVISSLGLHWFNDLPAIVAQCRFALKPDGLMLAALLGGDSLQELRISCSIAQMEVLGGVSPVVSPLAQVRDAGNLLTRASLAMPTVDVDNFKIQYHCPTDVIRHLRVMGESNAVVHRQKQMPRDVALAAAAVYKAMFEEEGTYPATYQVMYMTGWAPHESQQQAKERGSATMSFQDLANGLVGQGAVGGTSDGPGPEAASGDTPGPGKPQKQG